MNRQYNGQTKKDIETNKDLQNTSQKTKDQDQGYECRLWQKSTFMYIYKVSTSIYIYKVSTSMYIYKVSTSMYIYSVYIYVYL